MFMLFFQVHHFFHSISYMPASAEMVGASVWSVVIGLACSPVFWSAFWEVVFLVWSLMVCAVSAD